MTSGRVTPPSSSCSPACGATVRNSPGWWKAHDIRDVAAGEKRMVHPKKGVLRFQHASFQCNDEPGLKLVIYTPILSS